MFKDRVEALLDQALKKRPDIFLIKYSVGADNRIHIVLDGDKGISLEDCMEISRAVEHNLDREEQDFALEVSSAGATAPLESPRQFPQHIGRKLEVKTREKVLEGQLEKVEENGIELYWKAREPKPVGKGKHTVEKREFVPFEAIEKAQVKLKF